MFREYLEPFEYWMWQDLDAMCGSFEVVRPHLDSVAEGVVHHPRDLGGHWQLFSTAVFSENEGFWRRKYHTVRDSFFAKQYMGLDEVWLHGVLHSAGIPHAHVPCLEKTGQVRYIDGRLFKEGEGEFWTYHFLKQYMSDCCMRSPAAVYQQDRLLREKDGDVPAQPLQNLPIK
jgi:hypothetical protein